MRNTRNQPRASPTMRTSGKPKKTPVASLSKTGDSMKAVSQPQSQLPYPWRPRSLERKENILYAQSEDGEDIPICYAIKPEAYVRGETELRVWVLIKLMDDQGATHKLLVPKAECKDSKRLMDRLLNLGWDHFCAKKTAMKFLENLLTLMPPRKNLKLADRPGWESNGASSNKVFIYGNQVFVPEGEEPAVYFQGNAPFRQKGSLRDWQNFVAKLFTGNSRQILLLSAAFVGPILNLVKQPNIGILLHGASRAGKTATLAAICSVYGDEEIMESWKATANALLQSAVERNDLVFPLDELSQAKASDASEAAYDLMNGHSKRRLNSDSKVQPAHKFRLVTISTGEQSFAAYLAKYGITASAGQFARMLSIPFSSKGIFENTHGYKNHAVFAQALVVNAQKYYGTAGPAFIQHLVDHQGEIEQSAHAGIEKFQDILMSSCADLPETGVQLDVARRLATIAYAGELAIEIGILPFESGVAIRSARTCFKAWNYQYEAEAATRDPVFAGVKGYITDQLASFIALGKHRSAEGYPIGFTHTVDGIAAFLLTQQTFQRQLCLQHGKSAVIATLKARNLLMLGARGTPTRQITMPGSKSGKQSFYVINSNILSAT